MQPHTPTVVLIPSYKPDERLVTLCAELIGSSFSVLVVDDGGGPAFRSFFDEAEALGCAVVRHAVNLGKGRALKTGINEILNRFGEDVFVITADADGQHTCQDIGRIAEAMRAHPDALVTGSRAFSGNVPFKSRAGNAITRHVYRFVTGIRCHDTQTGLRGIPGHALGAMMALSGERYEYEMTMLLKLRDLSLPLHEVPIETIYIDDNKGSHFNPWRDATRIYSVILRYCLSSLLSFALDYVLYLLALHVLRLPPWLCYAVARVLSSLANYWINRVAVFGNRGGNASIVRYYILATLQMAAGAGLVELLSTTLQLNASWVKIPVDLLLFFVSFALQRDFVFAGRPTSRREE